MYVYVVQDYLDQSSIRVHSKLRYAIAEARGGCEGICIRQVGTGEWEAIGPETGEIWYVIQKLLVHRDSRLADELEVQEARDTREENKGVVE